MELHREGKREEGDGGDQEENRGNQKKREQSSQSSIPYVLSTVWNTQRGPWSYMEKRSERREIEMTRRRRGGVKRGETNLVIISSLSVLHSPEHPERFTEKSREEKGKEGDRGDLGEKKES